MFGLASQSPGCEPKKIPPCSACDIGSGICLEMVVLGFFKNKGLTWCCTASSKSCSWVSNLNLHPILVKGLWVTSYSWPAVAVTWADIAWGSPLTYWLRWVFLVLSWFSILPVWLFPFPLGWLLGKHNPAKAIFPLRCFQVLSNIGYCCALCVQQPQRLHSNYSVLSNVFFSTISVFWLPEIHYNNFKGDIFTNSVLPVPAVLTSPILCLMHFTILIVFKWSPQRNRWNQQYH